MVSRCVTSVLLFVFQKAASIEASDPSSKFASFVAEHARTYKKGGAEYEMRRAIFEKRVAEYDSHNSNPHKLWKAGANVLTDWTEDELGTLRGRRGVVVGGSNTMATGASHVVARHRVGLMDQQVRQLPQNVSWENLKSVRDVKNQGGCGSCWAYATALALDAGHEIKKGSIRTFSPMEMVNCAPNPQHCGGNGGCDGSTAELAMAYIMEHGLSDDGSCHNSKASLLRGKALDTTDWASILAPGAHAIPDGTPASQLGLTGWERLAENKAAPLMAALVEHGPVAVSVSADYWGGYKEGIFDSCPLDVTIDHAVTLVAFGADDSLGGKKYWRIQNSWGSYWGDHGHIRLLRQDSDDEHCGTDYQPALGTGCDGGPASVHVCGMCGVLYDSMVPHF